MLRVQQRHPTRTTVLVNQSCLSAGHARFLEQAAFHQQFRTTEWPILHVSTAGPWEASLGSFWPLWLDEWSRAVASPTLRTTLGDIYARAERRYYEVNASLRAHNEQAAHAAPTYSPLSFGTLNLHEGSRDKQPMRQTALWDLLIEEEHEQADQEAAEQRDGKRARTEQVSMEGGQGREHT